MRELGGAERATLANSFWRAVPRLSNTLATLTQAMSNKNPTAACSAHSSLASDSPFQITHRDHRRADACVLFRVLLRQPARDPFHFGLSLGHSYVGLEAGKRDKAITVWPRS